MPISSGLTRKQCTDFYDDVIHDKQNKNQLRLLCRDDLFFLLLIALNRPDVNHDWLYERIREVEAEPNNTLDLWAREHYKDLCCDTPILTDNGWKKHGELEIGDNVYSLNGKKTSVIATQYFDSSLSYEIKFTDGSNIKSGQGHLWLVLEHSRKRDNDKRINRYPAIRNTEYLSIIDHNKLLKSGGHRIAIPINFPLNGEINDLPIMPYTLGCWLGDGDNNSGRITCGDDIWENIKLDGYEISPYQINSSKCEYHTIYKIRPILAKHKILNNKHIPYIYLKSSISQRLALLQGLMDTDGHINDRGTATFVNKSYVLAKDTYDLCNTLGFNAKLRKYEAEHGVFWQVGFQAYKTMPPVRLKRKYERCKNGQPWGFRYIESVEPIGKQSTNCIQIADPSGLYLAGKELIPTHNSTIKTYALLIQDILCSHGMNPIKWDKEVTILILSHTRPIATKFMEQIKTELESNQFLKDLFPDVLYQNPQSEASKWSVEKGICVKRKSNPKECTIEASGLVDGQPTSGHWLILNYDDVVTDKSVSTPEQIKKTMQALELSYNLGVSEGGVKRFTGTYYDYGDAYHTIEERGTAKTRKYPGTIDGTEKGQSVFMSDETIRQKRKDMGPYIFSCQILLNPKEDSIQSFKHEWLTYYHFPKFKGFNFYLLCDPANEKKKTNDYTVMLVIALGFDLCYYLVDGIRDRLNLVERQQKFFYFHKKYHPIRSGYEEYGMQCDRQHFEYIMKEENYHFNITPLGGNKSKLGPYGRIQTLVPVYEQKRFLLPDKLLFVDYQGKAHDLVKEFVDDEYTKYPFAVHDDIFDCMARITDPALGAVFPMEKATFPYALETANVCETEFSIV